MSQDLLQVEVVYAKPDRQARYAIQMHAGATVQDAIAASRVLADFPEVDLRAQRVAIYGRLTTLDTVLRDGDRIEILRPLAIDPKEARRRRAARQGGRKT